MRYTYEICHNVNILIARLSGELYIEEVVPMDKEIRLKAKEFNCKIVLDFRGTINHMSLAEAYFWFTEDNKYLDLKCIPVAHITNEQDESFFNFLELTSNNKGCRIKMCKDEISALHWLNQF